MTEKEALLWVLGVLGSLCAAAITIDKVLDIIHKYIKRQKPLTMRKTNALTPLKSDWLR